MRQERKQVTIDLKLPSNEIMHFQGESVVMTERTQIPGLLENLNPLTSKSPFVKRSRRYDLAEIMNSSKGIINSPAFKANST